MTSDVNRVFVIFNDIDTIRKKGWLGLKCFLSVRIGTNNCFVEVVWDLAFGFVRRFN